MAGDQSDSHVAVSMLPGRIPQVDCKVQYANCAHHASSRTVEPTHLPSELRLDGKNPSTNHPGLGIRLMSITETAKG